MRTPILLSCLLAMLALACGGAAEPGPGGAQTTRAPALPEEPVVPVAEGPTGAAGQGADCDFGGAERLTCQAGLSCCYPEGQEVAYGTCAPSCPGYE